MGYCQELTAVKCIVSLLLIGVFAASASEVPKTGSSTDAAASLEQELMSSMNANENGNRQQEKVQQKHESHKPKQIVQQQQQQQQQHEEPVIEQPHHAVSRQQLRDLFRKLLSDSERRSLTVRIDPSEVKRTMKRMKERVRHAQEPKSKKHEQHHEHQHDHDHDDHDEHDHDHHRSSRQKKQMEELAERSLRMRRSLLAASQESSMSAASQRRKKRDLPEFSPEEYEQLLRSINEGQDGFGRDAYEQDGSGEIRLMEQPPAPLLALPELNAEEEIQQQPLPDLPDLFQQSEAADASNAVERDAAEEPAGSLTMFLVRVGGRRGLFVPLDQAAAAEAAEAVSSGEMQQLLQEREAEQAVEKAEDLMLREEARREGQQELRRFAEKLARRMPTDRLF